MVYFLNAVNAVDFHWCYLYLSCAGTDFWYILLRVFHFS